MRQRHKEKLTRKQKRIKHRVTLRTLFLLAITLIFNTYAWFMYATTVTTNLTAKVEAWKVEFEVNNQTIERVFTINIDHAYPGMADQLKTVIIRNRGDKVADISYAIKSVRIFDDKFVATDQLDTNETVEQGATSSTSAGLITKMQNDYPFRLGFTLNTATLAVGASTSMDINFEWDYDSGDDETDTDYGTEAYDFAQENPDTSSIEIVIKLIVVQHPD